MTKAEIRLRIVEIYPTALDSDWNKIYDWIMFPEMEDERLENERIEQEKQELEKQPIEPSAEEVNKLRIEQFIQRQKEKNQIIPRI